MHILPCIAVDLKLLSMHQLLEKALKTYLPYLLWYMWPYWHRNVTATPPILFGISHESSPPRQSTATVPILGGMSYEDTPNGNVMAKNTVLFGIAVAASVFHYNIPKRNYGW